MDVSTNNVHYNVVYLVLVQNMEIFKDYYVYFNKDYLNDSFIFKILGIIKFNQLYSSWFLEEWEKSGSNRNS